MTKHGNGVGTGFTFPSLYPTLVFLLVTLSISNGNWKSNLILVPDEFGYPCLILISAVDKLFFDKNKSIFSPERNVVKFLFSKEMMTIDDYGDGEERGQDCEI